MDCGWNWIFGDLEIFLTFFFILESKLNFPMDENRLSHTALTRWIDPRAPEGQLIFSKAEVLFVIFNFPDLGSTGPWDGTSNAENSRNPSDPRPNPQLGRDKPVVETHHWDLHIHVCTL